MWNQAGKLMCSNLDIRSRGTFFFFAAKHNPASLECVCVFANLRSRKTRILPCINSGHLL